MSRGRILPTRRELSQENQRLNSQLTMFSMYADAIRNTTSPDKLNELVLAYLEDKALTSIQKSALDVVSEAQGMKIEGAFVHVVSEKVGDDA